MKTWFNMTIEEVADSFGSSSKRGLLNEEIGQRVLKFGDNQLREKKKKTFLMRLIDQFKNILIIILLIAGVISFVLGEKIDAFIIIAIVILNAIMGLVQESKAEKSLEALKKMSAPSAKVMRSGNIKIIKSQELVPGDLVIIEAGDYIPADGRLIEAVNLKIEESALTGESLPSDKTEAIIIEENIALGDRKNMVASSTIVTYGRGKFIVTAIGMDTEIGKIADIINRETETKTPLQKKLESFGKILGVIALAVCLLIFLIGVLEGRDVFEMFFIAVSLAVAAIPEGLPAIVTIVLAIGVQRMVNKNAIIRKLPAVETLGSASVICSDKTGTLTQNKMTVVKIATYNEIFDIDSESNEGKVVNDDMRDIFKGLSLCNSSTLVKKDGKWNAIGDPTETALTVVAAKHGLIKDVLEKEYILINEVPFDSDRKMMSTIHKDVSGYIVYTKGAPDQLLKKCKYYMDNGEVKVLSKKVISSIILQNSEMADSALRVLGVAYKKIEALPINIVSEDIEKELIFLGLAGMIDPPREEVKAAIEISKTAGIRTIMITGDHRDTAVAIARELGILKKGEKAISGSELDLMSQDELNEKVIDYSVYARVSPEHKVRIVNAWQNNGDIVAMTGDGVNDAPALKKADIGCAMGITGTDVAKGAADMVLTNDNFSTIVDAVQEGRGIFDNIRKSIHFLLSCNIGEILVLFIAIVMNWETPLLPIHILWINLITDSFPALALGIEPVDKNIMKRKPRLQEKGIFADGLGYVIGYQGLMIGMITLLAFIIGWKVFGNGVVKADSLIIGRTMAFMTLAISQLVHSYNVRSDDSIFKIGIFSNKWINRAFMLSLLLQISVVMIPFLNKVFKVVMLNMNQWIIVIILSLIPIIIVEIVKLFSNKK